MLKRTVRILLLLIPLSIALFLISYYMYYNMRQHSIGSNIAGANQNAKYVFEAAASYTFTAGSHGVKIPDGIYTGNFTDNSVNEKYDNSFVGDAADIQNFLRTYCDFMKKGYYCVGIRNNIPFAAYWGDTDQVISHAPYLIGAAEQGISLENGDTMYTGGYTRAGGYPFYSGIAENGRYHLKFDNAASLLPVYGEQAHTPAYVYDIPIELNAIEIYIILSVFVIFVDRLAAALQSRKKRKNIDNSGDMIAET